MKRILIAIVAIALVASAMAPPGAAGATDQQAESYSGTNVSFESTANAVVDYAVDDETVMESVKVQSRSEARSQLGLDADLSLSALTSIAGASMSLDATTDVNATLTTGSGATVAAHDNDHGILVVSSSDESQYVTANLSSSADAESESDQRLTVTNANGTEGTFIVVGDGEVAVNERGNVSADLESESRLVYRSYAEGRSESDAREERLIAEGTAAAEVYVTESSEASDELASDVVAYSEDTTVEVTQQTEGTVNMTAERSAEQGRIVMTTVSEQAISSTDDLSVAVDGSAAAEASSHGELESAIGGDSSRYMVRQQSSAEASSEVLVAVDHFSSRNVSMTENGGGDGDGSSGFGPGFGVLAALLALVAAAGLARRRRH